MFVDDVLLARAAVDIILAREARIIALEKERDVAIEKHREFVRLIWQSPDLTQRDALNARWQEIKKERGWE